MNLHVLKLQVNDIDSVKSVLQNSIKQLEPSGQFLILKFCSWTFGQWDR